MTNEWQTGNAKRHERAGQRCIVAKNIASLGLGYDSQSAGSVAGQNSFLEGFAVMFARWYASSSTFFLTNEKDILAGLAVFFSMSYAAFAIPAILEPDVHFTATCLVAGLASWAAGYFARVPNAVAPGIALAVAISQFKPISIANALVVCIFAGFVLLLTTWSSHRRLFVDTIPPTIKLALAGGIGSLLAEQAVKSAYFNGKISPDRTTLLVIGIAFIVFGYIVLRGVSFRIGRYTRGFDIFGRSFIFLSVPLIAFLAHMYFPSTIGSKSVSGGYFWLSHSVEFNLFFKEYTSCIVFFFFILYILFADIIGSPYYMALEEAQFDPLKLTAEKEQIIQKSFYVHSVVNIMAPIIGTSPLVYYAENHVAQVLGGKGPLVPYVAALGFFLMFAFGIWLGMAGRPIESLIPEIAVSPVLFFVGIIIIAKTLAASLPQVEVSLKTRSGKSIDPREAVELWGHMPAAIAIVVTPVAGFDVGVSLAIVSYYLFSAIMPLAPDESDGDRQVGAIVVMLPMAIITLFVKAAALVQHIDGS
jgi:AGZA family xanthine/uracil permease-like MFS transporter